MARGPGGRDEVTVLPREIVRPGVPPVKCQGIKTKLVPFIFASIRWNSGESGRWIEPFLGSGVVALNLAPDRALLADSNEHIIRLYQAIQRGELTRTSVQPFLAEQGAKLRRSGGDHYYYEVRERFNRDASSYDFLFLNRSCFNGVMRFNGHGQFNVPFGHKPDRFSRAYITKIGNQVNWAAKQIQGKDWTIRVADWRETLAEARAGDFVYLDPPYIGRHTDYYSAWTEAEARELAAVARALPCGFALSMWLENRHRRNAHVDEAWPGLALRQQRHFYHVGSREQWRNAMDEALIVHPAYVTEEGATGFRSNTARAVQLPMLAERE